MESIRRLGRAIWSSDGLRPDHDTVQKDGEYTITNMEATAISMPIARAATSTRFGASELSSRRLLRRR